MRIDVTDMAQAVALFEQKYLTEHPDATISLGASGASGVYWVGIGALEHHVHETDTSSLRAAMTRAIGRLDRRLAGERGA